MMALTVCARVCVPLAIVTCLGRGTAAGAMPGIGRRFRGPTPRPTSSRPPCLRTRRDPTSGPRAKTTGSRRTGASGNTHTHATTPLLQAVFFCLIVLCTPFWRSWDTWSWRLAHGPWGVIGGARGGRCPPKRFWRWCGARQLKSSQCRSND